MGTLSLVSEYLKDLEECMNYGDSRVAKEAKLFDALEYKSVVIEVDNKKITIFTKAPLRAFGEPFMRYPLPCKVDGQGAWEAKLDLTDSANYITEKVLESMGFVHVSLSDYGRKMVNDVNLEIHGVKFKANFVVLDYVNEGEPSILFGRDFLATTKSQVDFGLGEIRLNERLNKKEFSEEDKVGIIEHGLPKKTCGPKNFVLPVKINGVVEMVALVDTGASVCVLPYRTYGVIIDMGRGMLCIDDEVIRHTYFPKPQSKSYVEAFEMEGEDDWLGSFQVGRDEDGNMKYGSVAPSFIDTEDDIERAGNEGYGTYKKVDGDGNWHARFEIVTPSGRKFNQKIRKDTLPNPLIAEYERRNKRNTITYSLQPVLNANLKWKDFPSIERQAYFEKLSKLQERSFGVPRVANWRLFDGYGFEDTLREMMKLKVASRERCQKQDLWTMSALEESRGLNLAWIIADHLYKHAPGTKENNVICTGHYVTRIACFLSYCMDDEIKKCLKPIDCEYWISKMLADELDMENTCLKKETKMPTQAEERSQQGNFAYLTYEPLNVPPYPYPYTHYHNPGNQSNQGGSYELGGDDYFMSAMPDFIGSSSGYAVGCSFRGAGFNDEDDIDE
nr:hypothetical protein [Tanacetum cinerariifolium]